MLQFLRILGRSFKLAMEELANNKLRSFLSLLGITIGIFCIISIFTGVDFLNTFVTNSVKGLGEKTVYIDKWFWRGSSDYPWWVYQKRTYPSYQNFQYINKHSNLTEQNGHVLYLGNYTIKSVEYDKSVQVDYVNSITDDVGNILNIELLVGRYFSTLEFRNGGRVTILGEDIAKEIFGNVEKAIDNIVRIKGKKVRVVGVSKSKGSLATIIDFRTAVLLPYRFGRTFEKIDPVNTYQVICSKAKENVPLDYMIDELTGLIRGARKLRPIESDDFEMNRIDIFEADLRELSRILRITGALLGFFSLLVGGFGIANIMFVSVKERTKFIGIKKAIGAKKGVVLLEFLIESIFLCIVGSLIGLVLVYLLAFVASKALNLEFVLSAGNILLGIGISVIIGIIAGIIPAWLAAKMDPVKAIRS